MGIGTFLSYVTPYISSKHTQIDSKLDWMMEEKVTKYEDIKQEWDRDFLSWSLKLAAGDK